MVVSCVAIKILHNSRRGDMWEGKEMTALWFFSATTFHCHERLCFCRAASLRFPFGEVVSCVVAC